jgi:hypothetical protein
MVYFTQEGDFEAEELTSQYPSRAWNGHSGFAGGYPAQPPSRSSRPYGSFSRLCYTPPNQFEIDDMKTRTKKTVTTALAPEELAEFDRVRGQQGLSRAEAVRDAIRWYVGAIGRLPPAEETSWEEAEAIRQGKEQIARGEYIRLEDLQDELGLPTK